jgi:hypothetical protein
MTTSQISERGMKLLRAQPRAVEPPPESLYYDAGGSTYHTHTCLVEPKHEWRCNSPYCQVLTDPCPDHGGEEPVRIGREPWGR